MKSDVESLSPTRVKLTVEMPAAELAPHIDAAFKKIAGQVNIPGFRRGKVPARIIEQRFGRGAVLEEALNAAIPAAYDRAVEDAGLFPVGQPELDVTELSDTEDVSFTAEVDIRPDFELPDYSAMTVTVDDVEVSEDDVNEQLDGLRGRFATLTDVDRPAAEGDVLQVDISASAGGEEVPELAATAMSFEIGGDLTIPGFSEAVTGAVAGDQRSFQFTPEGGARVGQPIDVTVIVHAVRERVLPPADDDFAAMASEFDTIEELAEDTRTRLSRVKRMEQGIQARSRIHDALLEMVDIPVPQSLLDAELSDHFDDGHGDDTHRAEFEAEARTKIRSMFILDRIADEQDLKVSQEEMSAWLIQQAGRYQMSPDQFADALVKAGQVQLAFTEARRAKALGYVMDHAKVVDESGNEVDFEALNNELRELQ